MTYLELYEKRKNDLEAKFFMAQLEKDRETEAKILYKMLIYGMIDRLDVRLEKKEVTKYKKVLDREQFEKFEKQLNIVNAVPKNMIYNTPLNMQFKVFCESHWTKRVELQYEGDIIAEEKYINYSIFEKSNVTQAIAAVKNMEDLYRKLFKSDTFKINRDLIEKGGHRIYDISLANGQSFKIRKLGYIYIKIVKQDLVIMPLLEHDLMIEQCIDIKNTYKELEDKFKEEFNSIGVKNIKFEYLVDIERINKYQHSILRRKPIFDIAE